MRHRLVEIYPMNVILFLLTFVLSALYASETNPNQIVYLMHAGDTAKAFQAYEEHYAASGCHDFELIERLGLILLDQGLHAKDPESRLLALYGAGISLNEKALYIIEEALEGNEPELQLAALNLIDRIRNDRIDQLLYRAMASDQLLIRFEAAMQLASKRDPKAVGQIESLMMKVPEQLWPLFPQLFALIDNREAKKVLRRMLMHSQESIRIAAILSIASQAHDDFLPTLRRMAAQHGAGQQEASAAALGILRDDESILRLQTLSKSQNPHIRLASLKALYQLGKDEVREEVEKLAKMKNLFAIHLLGEMRGSEPTLASLLNNGDLPIRLNAAMSLLELHDPRCTPMLAAVLLKDRRDIALTHSASPGRSLQAWRIIPSATQNLENNPLILELSLNLRESLVLKAVDLPEKEFLALADLLLDQQQNDLIPVLIQTLENHPTPASIALLKKYQQKAGAPLVRNYCNLALYRLKQPGPYAEHLRTWVFQQKSTDLIRFRPLVNWSFREDSHSSFDLTPEETSRLLLDAFQSFVATQDDKGIDTLISLIQSGNPKNKYALIGLLMRAIQ